MRLDVGARGQADIVSDWNAQKIHGHSSSENPFRQRLMHQNSTKGFRRRTFGVVSSTIWNMGDVIHSQFSDVTTAMRSLIFAKPILAHYRLTKSLADVSSDRRWDIDCLLCHIVRLTSRSRMVTDYIPILYFIRIHMHVFNVYFKSVSRWMTGRMN